MNKKQIDWIDLLLIVVGAVVGIAVFGFVGAPLIGLEVLNGNPLNYVVAVIVGSLGGYLLRFSVARFRRH